jgi:hypothetical protein
MTRSGGREEGVIATRMLHDKLRVIDLFDDRSYNALESGSHCGV